MAQAKKALAKSGSKQNSRASSRATVKTYNNYIGGKWVPSESGEVFENINPADTDDVIGRFQLSTSDDVNAAVNAPTCVVLRPPICVVVRFTTCVVDRPRTCVVDSAPTSVVFSPLSCVALGTGRALEEMKTLKNLLINMW